MFSERLFEDILIKYPELIEKKLKFVGRQVNYFGKRIDILFEDQFNQKLIVEIKKDVLNRNALSQVMEYEGYILSEKDSTARVMIVANRIPLNLKKAMDHHGIEYRELTQNQLLNFLKERDIQLFNEFIRKETTITEKEKPIEQVSHKVEHLSNLFISKLDQSKYSLEQMYEKQKPNESVKNIINKFHEILINKLRVDNKYIIIRTNGVGFTYFVNDKKAFIFSLICQNYLSMRFFTGNSIIKGLNKGIWLSKNDNLGSETFRITDDDSLMRAIDFALIAYKIAEEWPGTGR